MAKALNAGKLQTLPVAQNWWLWALASSVVGVAIGALGQVSPQTLSAQFQIDLWLNSIGNQPLDAIAATAGEIYSPKFAITITILTSLFVWASTKSILDAAAISAITAFGWLPAQAFKQIIDEARPDQGLLNRLIVAPETDNAFPSGHVCFAISFGYAIYLLLRSTRWRTLVLILWLASVVIMAWARMYSGVHYLTDVLGSCFASVAGLLLISYLWNLLTTKLQSRLRAK